MRTSAVFDRIVANHKKRITILQGGTSSSKTYSTLQYLYFLASQSKRKLLISVVGETGPNLHRGAIRDFINILGDDYTPMIHNKSTETFLIGKSQIEFFSLDKPTKAHGSRRDILYINECNNTSRKLYDQLEPRTRLKVFLDFNPLMYFWAHELMAELNPEDYYFDVSTYKDALPFLDAATIRSIESRRLTNPNWYRVFGEGQIGAAEGLIIPNIELIDALPKGLETTCGLDFGFNDPSALVETGLAEGCIYINEVFYGRGMTNQAIIKEMERKEVPKDYLIYADHAEPKSIREIYNGGYTNIKGCEKGDDCFRHGVDYILGYKVKVTKNSTNVIKDLRSAMWETDIMGNAMNKPKKTHKHSIDAIIYSNTSRVKPLQSVKGGIM